MMVLAQESFWPTSAGGWVPLLMFAGALLGGGWAGVTKITRAIEAIGKIDGHTQQIDDLNEKADALDRGQVAILDKLGEMHEGMVTAAEMTTHTHQDAAMFDQLTGQLTTIQGQVGSIDGRIGRVEDHVGLERLDPEQR